MGRKKGIRLIKNCEYCNLEFKVMPCHSTRRFCSLSCGSKGKTRKKYILKKENKGWFQKGHNPHNTGISPNNKTRDKISNALKGHKLEDSHKLYCKCGVCKSKRFEIYGENHPSYIDGRTPLSFSIRALLEYTNWKNYILIRDNYTCQKCGYKCIDKEVHHVRPFAIIFDEFLKEYSLFSPIEDKETLIRLAMIYKPFWDISNGQTLCKDCHKKELNNTLYFIKNYNNIKVK